MDPSDLPESFIEQIKEALESLYNFAALQHHLLTSEIGSRLGDGEAAPAHILRRHLIDAIETLNPGHQVAVRASEARIYNLMHLYYIRRLSIQEVCMEVGISRRQLYRDLRAGYEQVAAILWYKIQPALNLPEVSELSSINLEITHLEAKIHSSDLKKLLENALKTVQVLLERHNTQLIFQSPPNPTFISTNPAIAQQILTHLLSQTIQQAKPAYLDIDLAPSGNDFILKISLLKPTPGFVAPTYDESIEALMSKLRWKFQAQHQAAELKVVIRALQSKLTVLIIDDNQGLVDLLERYLTDEKYYVTIAYTGEDGLHLAQDTQPDAIIMDLMMPGMDGWELLQHLRTNIQTQNIPVIICSVINDPELAYSLGASTFVKKPVSKETILKALSTLNL